MPPKLDTVGFPRRAAVLATVTRQVHSPETQPRTHPERSIYPLVDEEADVGYPGLSSVASLSGRLVCLLVLR
jgi:hypothetical protein